MALSTGPFAKPQAEAGTIRMLATTGATRDPVLPNTPTLREAGLPVTVQVVFGLLAPAGVPEPILARIGKEVAEVAKDPAVVERLAKLGYQSAYMSGPQYREFILKDLDQWRAVAKAANIKIEN
jgi:tripartite-type tricarboxylate transporter receptor subunit TctC